MKHLLVLCVVLMVAIGCAPKARKVAPEHPDTYGVRAYRYFQEGNLVKALELYKRGFVSARRADNVLKAGHYLFNTGRVYYELGILDSAAAYLIRSYDDLLYYKDSVSASRAAAFVSLCRAKTGNGDDASFWLTKTETLRGGDCEVFYGFVAARVSWILSGRIKDPGLLERAYALYTKKKDYASRSQLNQFRAEIELGKGNCTASLELLEQSLSDLDKTPERFRRYSVLVALAGISFCRSENEQARRYYGRAVDCAPIGITLPSLDQISVCVSTCNR